MSHIFRKIHNPDGITQEETRSSSLAEHSADGLETMTSDPGQACLFAYRVSGSVGQRRVTHLLRFWYLT